MTREEQIIENAYMYESVARDEFRGTVESFKAGAHWADIHSKSPWINTKDNMPHLQDRCLVYLKIGGVSTARLTTVYGKIYWDVDINPHQYMNLNEVDFWMPIPELPKGGEE